jgi:integrase
MARNERQIWPRHKAGCEFIDPKDSRKWIKGCVCPIYARVQVVHPDTGDVLFRYNASLYKLGIRNMENAGKLVDKWVHDYRAGKHLPQAQDAKLNMMVDEVRKIYLERKAPTLKLKPWHRDDPTRHGSYKKYNVLLLKMVAYGTEHKVPLIKQWDTDTVYAFQKTWEGLGRRVKNLKTGEFTRRPKSKTATNREQGLMKKFFKWCKKHGYITVNPCDNVDPVSAPDLPANPYTPAQRERIFSLIPEVFPNLEQQVRIHAFAQLLEKSGCRISAVATAATAQLEDDGIWLREHKGEKTSKPNMVWRLLPPDVVAELRNLTPTCKDYFFWTGNSTLKTLVTDWSGKMLKLYRAAGIPEGQRNHEWRDTMGESLQEVGADVGHIQLAYDHDKQLTTEKHYLGKNKRKFAELDDYKRKIWGMKPVVAETALVNIAAAIEQLASQLERGLITRGQYEAARDKLYAPIVWAS